MRVRGHNILAILVAAVAMYAIGALIYGLFLSAAWQAATGYEPAQYAGLEWRMALSPVMPILIAIGLALIVQWRGVVGPVAGAKTGLIAALFFLFPARLYNFVYSPESPNVLCIDTLHLFLLAAVGGAIIGAWR
jgi:hypothetical protein